MLINDSPLLDWAHHTPKHSPTVFLGRAARILAPKALAHYEVGEVEEAETYIGRLVELGVSGGAVATWRGVSLPTALALASRITGSVEETDSAEDLARTVLSTPVVAPLFAVLARVALALVAVERRDSEAAEEQYPELQGHRGTLLSDALAADRLLGLLAHTMGKLDDAAAHFEDALAFCRKAGYRPELAWSCRDYADMLRERNAPGDQAKATALLDESLTISRELGMRPLMERVLSRREILGA